MSFKGHKKNLLFLDFEIGRLSSSELDCMIISESFNLT